MFGPRLFADMVDVTFDLAQQFHGMLVDAEDFEPLHVPQCNIVSFRHVPTTLDGAPLETVDQLQFKLRRRIIESGDFYIVSTKIEGRSALRATIINPLTTADDLRELLDAIRDCARQMIDNGEI